MIEIKLAKDYRYWKKGETLKVRKPLYDTLVKDGFVKVKKVTQEKVEKS